MEGEGGGEGAKEAHVGEHAWQFLFNFATVGVGNGTSKNMGLKKILARS